MFAGKIKKNIINVGPAETSWNDVRSTCDRKLNTKTSAKHSVYNNNTNSVGISNTGRLI